MSGISTRWVVLAVHPVTEQDLDAGGTVSDETVERWIDAARSAYLDRCTVLRQMQERSGLVLRHRPGIRPSGALLGRPTDVAVTASASEVRPASFTISVRMRPGGGDRDLPVNATCVIRLEDEATGEVRELGTEIRDELIALEHSATHFN
jgi:acyl-CoA thioesterase FadM